MYSGGWPGLTTLEIGGDSSYDGVGSGASILHVSVCPGMVAIRVWVPLSWNRFRSMCCSSPGTVFPSTAHTRGTTRSTGWVVSAYTTSWPLVDRSVGVVDVKSGATGVRGVV